MYWIVATSNINMTVYISVANCKLLSISDLLTIFSRQQGVGKSVLFCERKMISSQTLTYGEEKTTLKVKVLSKVSMPLCPKSGWNASLWPPRLKRLLQPSPDLIKLMCKWPVIPEDEIKQNPRPKISHKFSTLKPADIFASCPTLNDFSAENFEVHTNWNRCRDVSNMPSMAYKRVHKTILVLGSILF